LPFALCWLLVAALFWAPLAFWVFFAGERFALGRDAVRLGDVRLLAAALLLPAAGLLLLPFALRPLVEAGFELA
jgi:hypothetical protein